MKYYYWLVGDISAEWVYHYCGGIVLVSATNAEEAKQLILSKIEFEHLVKDKYIDIDKVYELEDVQKDIEPRVLIGEYYIE